MATYDFIRPGDAAARDHSVLDKWDGIRGLRGIDADRLIMIQQLGGTARTAGGTLRQPGNPWDAHVDADKMKKITGVERRTGEDYTSGSFAVLYEDGTEDVLTGKDLLCVEQPIPSPVRHYGGSRTACGEPLGESDGITRAVGEITCRGCKTVVHAEV